MAYVPPVNIPSLGGRDYAGQLYGMFSGVGDAFRQNRRDKVSDSQWQADMDRALANDARAQSNADRNYALELQKFEADQAAGDAGPKYYGSPQWYQREDGGMGFGVLGTDGSFKDMPAPPGAQWAPPVTFQDTGTAKVPMFTRGGGPAGAPLPVDVAGKKTQEQIGTGTGEAVVALPIIEQNADFVMRTIDEAINDPYLSSVTGDTGGRLPTWFSIHRSTREGAARAQSRIDQILGQTFLLAYDKIRGAGQITEYESQRASDALNRLKTQEMSDEEYLATLNEFRNEVVRLVNLARQRAAAGQQGQVMTTPGGVQFQKVGP